MKDYGVWEPYTVKAQTVKTAIESACLLLRVDDIVSGTRRGGGGGGGGMPSDAGMAENEAAAQAEAQAER
jgi:T-complex protein 1 subunit gamma